MCLKVYLGMLKQTKVIGDKDMVEIETDADTGNEIIHFIRYHRHYLYLRDKKTKVLIKRLKYVEKRVFMVVDYREERAKKGNPLYIDSGIFAQINPEEFLQRTQIDDKLEKTLEDRVEELFGPVVVKQLLDLAGEEYGSTPAYTSKHEENKATALIVWKHKKTDKPRKDEKEVTL